MSLALLAKRPEVSEIHPELAAIEQRFRADTSAPADPCIISQGYNVSPSNSPAGPVLPSPYGATTAWEFVSQSGDSSCVRIDWEGYCGFTLGCTLTWLHPGQTTVVLNAVDTAGPGRRGEYQLRFSIVAC